MKAKFLGLTTETYPDRDTGEIKSAYRLQLHDGSSARVLAISEDQFKALQRRQLQPFSDVELSFGFAEGRFGRDRVTVTDLTPVGVARS